MINYPNLLIDIVLLYLFKITMHLVDFYLLLFLQFCENTNF